MPFNLGMMGGGFRFPSRDEMAIAEQWLDKQSTLYKAAMDGKPITKGQKRVLNKLGTVFSPSSLLGNMANHGALENPQGPTTHRILREAARKSVIDALLIAARLHQVKHVAQRVIIEGKQKGFNVVHFRHSDPDFTPDKNVQQRCNEMEEFLMRPRREVHPGGIRDLMIRAVEGELIMDRKVMIIERDRRFRPLNFHVIPPDNVKPRPEVLNPLMAKMNAWGPAGEERAARMIYSATGIDVSDAAYIQEVDGQVVGAWRAEEISVDMTLPTSEIDHWYYGVSPLERSLAITTLLIHAFNYNEKLFTVNWPEAFLALKGDVTDVELQAFKNMIYAQVGEQGNQRLPVIALGEESNGAELLKLRDTLREMEYSQLIRLAVCLKAAAYRAHPSLLNMAPDSGSVAPLISNADQETQLAMSVEEGLHSILDNQAQWWTRELVQPAYEDLVVVFTLQDAPTQQQQIEIWSKKLEMGYTVDEFRASQGDTSLAKATEGRSRGDYVNSQFFFQQQQQLQMEQQAAEAAEAGQTAMPAEPGEEDEPMAEGQ